MAITRLFHINLHFYWSSMRIPLQYYLGKAGHCQIVVISWWFLYTLEHAIMLIWTMVTSKFSSFHIRLFILIQPQFALLKNSSSWCIFCRYVVEKDIENNVVFVSRNYFSVDKRRRVFRVGSLKWLGGLPPNQFCQLRCKVEVSILYSRAFLHQFSFKIIIPPCSRHMISHTQIPKILMLGTLKLTCFNSFSG